MFFDRHDPAPAMLPDHDGLSPRRVDHASKAVLGIFANMAFIRGDLGCSNFT
jgi:hypothetical protein